MAVVGPTASGKSEIAVAVARALDGIVLSVDSMQVYRRMDIGTAKPTMAERQGVPHRMIDLVEPAEEYSVAEFQSEARSVIAAADRPVVIAGGSGLHFRAVVDPLVFPPTDPQVRSELEASEPGDLVRELVAADPEADRWVDLDNPRRVIRAVEILRLTGMTPSARAGAPERRAVDDYRPLLSFRAFGVDTGAALAGAVTRRLHRMREAGLLAEVRSLRSELGRTASQAVGYKQLIPVADGLLDEEAGFAAAESATLGLARRQRTYFRRDPRITWLSEIGESAAARIIEEVGSTCAS